MSLKSLDDMMHSGFGVIIAILLLFVMVLLFSQRKGYNLILFKLYARSLKLSKKHLELLEALIVEYRPSKPYQLFKPGTVLNNLLKRAIDDVDGRNIDEIAKADLRFNYYKIRHLIELNSVVGREIKNTNDLPMKGKLLLTLDDHPDFHFLCELRGQRQNHFIITVPKTKNNDHYAKEKEAIDWARGLKFSALYLGRHHEEYFFTSKVLGVASNTTQPTLLCAYSSSIDQVRRRRYLRRNSAISATIAPLISSDAPIKVGVASPCTIINISLGGCALKTSSKIEPQAAICIQFTIENESIICYGKALRCERRGQEILVRVQFTRATKASLNGISAMIYDL